MSRPPSHLSGEFDFRVPSSSSVLLPSKNLITAFLSQVHLPFASFNCVIYSITAFLCADYCLAMRPAIIIVLVFLLAQSLSTNILLIGTTYSAANNLPGILASIFQNAATANASFAATVDRFLI